MTHAYARRVELPSRSDLAKSTRMIALVVDSPSGSCGDGRLAARRTLLDGSLAGYPILPQSIEPFTGARQVPKLRLTGV